MELGQAALLSLASGLIVVSALLTIVPIYPGIIATYGIILVAAFLNNFVNITPLAFIVISGIMLFGFTSDFWLPLVGVKTAGLSLLSGVGSIVGGLVGTFIIPVPIIGTLVGTIAGALLVELLLYREMRKAMIAGKTALKLFMVGYAIEFGTVVLMTILFFVSLFSTR